MPPLPPIKKDTKERRLQSILDLAKRINQCLKNRDEIPQAVEDELEHAVHQSFPINTGVALASRLSELDSQGCELWNATNNILREQDNEQVCTSQPRLVALLRAFAFFLVDTAYRNKTSQSQNPEKRIRCFKTALKACKSCLDRSELEVALKVLERCSELVSATQQQPSTVQLSSPHAGGERQSILESLVTEFFLLRITHAWKSERLDLADHFFLQLTTPQLVATTRTWEKSMDLFHEVGKSLLKKGLDEPAMKWLDRALEILDTGDEAYQNPEAVEFCLATIASIVECLLSKKDSNSLERAQGFVDQLCKEYGLGGRLAVQIMQMRVFLSHEPVPVRSLQDAILLTVRSTVLTEETFKLIMQSIHRIKKVDIEIACEALTELLDVRLLDDCSEQPDVQDRTQVRIELVVVTYTHYATDAARMCADLFASLQKVLDSVLRHGSTRFSSEATHAAQTLMWKAANESNSETAEKWYTLLQHLLFDSAGQINKDRIARKSILTATEAGNFTKARATFLQMPLASQNEPLTRYLAFKMAIGSNDYYLAEESLQQIAKQSKDDQTFLYACVLAAQQADMRSVAVAALQAILDKQSPGTYLPSLLRCTARLLIAELRSTDASMEEEMEGKMEEIVQVFERAAGNISTLRNMTAGKWRDEVQWWSKNAYNLSLEYCVSMRAGRLARLLHACIAFIDAYPASDKALQEEGLKKRKALCHSLCATSHVVLGRTSVEASEDSLQNYLFARQQISAFKATHNHMVGKSHDEMNSNTFGLLKFDLECILHLKQWDQLDAAVQECLACGSVDRWDTLADVVLIIRQQPDVANGRVTTIANMNKLLDKIINQTWQQDKNIARASRWLRLSFSMDLNNGTGDFALELLRQAATMAKKGYAKEDGTYPETELQWLSSTAFNKAVDLLSAGKMDGSTDWFQAGLELARYADDNGALHANLTERYGLAMARLKQIQK